MSKKHPELMSSHTISLPLNGSTFQEVNLPVDACITSVTSSDDGRMAHIQFKSNQCDLDKAFQEKRYLRIEMSPSSFQGTNRWKPVGEGVVQVDAYTKRGNWLTQTLGKGKFYI
jgi:hypothetical protein